MSWKNTLKRATSMLTAEVESMLSAAEANTPNLDQYAKREYLDIEVKPRHLVQGDVVVAVEHDREHKAITDMMSSKTLTGTVFSVDKHNELVVFILENGNMETVEFSEARFFKKDELEKVDLAQEDGKKSRKQKSKGPKIRREDMEDDVIYEGEVVE